MVCDSPATCDLSPAVVADAAPSPPVAVIPVIPVVPVLSSASGAVATGAAGDSTASGRGCDGPFASVGLGIPGNQDGPEGLSDVRHGPGGGGGLAATG